mmetsp:Transcript_27478/g.40415  ORF Transcript_27478/g.40415 Transcript_27478/m.40415 type:complete len:111 (-) Transcript_27478:212-544(-)
MGMICKSHHLFLQNLFAQFNSDLQYSPYEIATVDSIESLEFMPKEVTSNVMAQMSKKETGDNGGANLLDFIVGIDCEWKPTGAFLVPTKTWIQIQLHCYKSAYQQFIAYF